MPFAALLILAVAAQARTADEIMALVAANQDRSVAEREQFVYHQNVLVRMKKPGGKLAWEEMRDYDVAPSASGTKRELVALLGKYPHGSKEETYDKAHEEVANSRIDGTVVKGLAESTGAHDDSKDGVGSGDFFPLTTKEQEKYAFQLDGEEDIKGVKAIKVTFSPKKHVKDDACFSGEALIDPEEFEPIEVTTHMTCKIPMLVKVALGINVQHLGFRVAYQKFGTGVWFPVAYSGEFKIRVLFLYARTVGLGLRNSDFKRTNVEAKIQFETP